MTRLSLGEAWNEAAAFVRREWRLLYPIAFLLNALPFAVAMSTMPQGPGGDGRAGVWMILLLAAMLISIVGSVAISFLGIRSGRSVGEGLRRGARRFPALLGVYLMLFLVGSAAMLIGAILALLLNPGMISGGGEVNPAASGPVVGIMVLVMIPLMLFLGTRLMLVVPVAAAEEGGPIAVATRAWALSGPVFWQLLGFLLLSTILAAVINQVATWLIAFPFLLAAGPPRPGSIAAVVMLLGVAVVGAAVTMFLTTVVARIYVRLAGDSPAAGTRPSGI